MTASRYIKIRHTGTELIGPPHRCPAGGADTYGDVTLPTPPRFRKISTALINWIVITCIEDVEVVLEVGVA